MSPMLEKAARALYELMPMQDQNVDADLRPLGKPYNIPWEDLNDEPRAFAYEEVRAVLLAIREVDEGMVASALSDADPAGELDGAPPEIMAEIVWKFGRFHTSLINHILGDGGDGDATP